MISMLTPDTLQKLKNVLDRIMKDGDIKNKYVYALQDAIDELTKEGFQLITQKYAVSLNSTEEGGVVIDIFDSTGPLIDTIEYDPSDILTNDSEAGEA
jgi:hypothetical protein